jgi:hypothetical protein
MATYRWVGSGTTASTSPEIFNWNNPLNWRKLVIEGSIKYFIGATYSPGFNDIVIFGSSPALAGMTNVERTKSPCLFGGVAGTVASGTWLNSLNPAGTTATNAIIDLYLDHDNTSVGFGNLNSKYSYGRNNENIDICFKEMPFGGGLTGNLSCFNNLTWIMANYPNMGVAITGGGTAAYAFTIPAGYTASWDNITVKVRDKVRIYHHGLWNLTGTIDLKFLPAYKLLTASITGPVALDTTMEMMYNKNVKISGGGFKSMSFTSVINAGGPTASIPANILTLPSLNLTGNLYASTIHVPSRGYKLIDSDVRFISLNVGGYHLGGHVSIPNGGISQYLGNENKLNLFGSGSVTQVNSVLYPGNTANTNNVESSVTFTLMGVDRYGGTGLTGATLGSPSALDWAQLSTAHVNYHMNSSDGTTSESHQYFDNLPMGPSAVADLDQKPYTQEIVIGGEGLTSVDIGLINLSKYLLPGEQHDYQIPVLKFEGQSNINSVYLGNYSMLECEGSKGTVNIGQLKLGTLSLLNLRGSENNFNFGIRGSNGVTGGIMAMSSEEINDYGGHNPTLQIGPMPMGKIIFPDADSAGDIRLFNVNTKKSGALQVTESTIAEIAQVSGTNKKG